MTPADGNGDGVINCQANKLRLLSDLTVTTNGQVTRFVGVKKRPEGQCLSVKVRNLWERACSRRRCVRRHQCWLCRRLREQARSHRDCA